MSRLFRPVAVTLLVTLALWLAWRTYMWSETREWCESLRRDVTENHRDAIDAYGQRNVEEWLADCEWP
jgi:hypothetical protein